MINENISNPVIALSLRQKTDLIMELTKIRITSFVTITTIFGYLCAAGGFSLNMIAPILGILLLACGAAVLNHYQERKTDAMMGRTKNRPIPSGKISAQDALNLALFLVIVGSVMLYLGAGLIALGLGLLNLVVV